MGIKIQFCRKWKKVFSIDQKSNKSFEHLMYKSAVAMILLKSTVKNKNIKVEYPKKVGTRIYVADIYAKKDDKEFWFECLNISEKKLKNLIKRFSGRVINVINHQDLYDTWHFAKVRRDKFFIIGVEY